MFKSLFKNILLVNFLSFIFFVHLFVRDSLGKIIDSHYTTRHIIYSINAHIFGYGVLFVLPFFVVFTGLIYYLKNSNNSNVFLKSLIIPFNYGLFINFLAVVNGLLVKQSDSYDGWIFAILIITSVITFFSVFFINLALQFFINRKKLKSQIPK